MTPSNIVERAMELCGQDITGWRGHEAHHRMGAPRPMRSTTWPFTSEGMSDCPWTGDMLAARSHRRRLIAESE